MVLLDSVTLTAPSAAGQTVTLGELVADIHGNAVGYTIEELTLDAAPLILQAENIPARRGGLVYPGRASNREVTLTGTILAGSKQEVNRLRRLLNVVVGDHGDDLISLRYQPEGVELEILGALDGSVEYRDIGGHRLSYSLRLVCPEAVALSVETKSSSAATVTNAGDAPTFPTYRITVDTGTVTGLVLSNRTPTEPRLELVGITVTAVSVIAVDTRPGRESITATRTDPNSGITTVTNLLPFLTRDSQFLPLLPGSNPFTLTLTQVAGTSTTKSVAWRDGYIS